MSATITVSVLVVTFAARHFPVEVQERGAHWEGR